MASPNRSLQGLACAALAVVAVSGGREGVPEQRLVWRAAPRRRAARAPPPPPRAAASRCCAYRSAPRSGFMPSPAHALTQLAAALLAVGVNATKLNITRDGDLLNSLGRWGPFASGICCAICAVVVIAFQVGYPCKCCALRHQCSRLIIALRSVLPTRAGMPGAHRLGRAPCSAGHCPVWHWPVLERADARHLHAGSN